VLDGRKREIKLLSHRFGFRTVKDFAAGEWGVPQALITATGENCGLPTDLSLSIACGQVSGNLEAGHANPGSDEFGPENSDQRIHLRISRFFRNIPAPLAKTTLRRGREKNATHVPGSLHSLESAMIKARPI
jgi:hypothetical protein